MSKTLHRRSVSVQDVRRIVIPPFHNRMSAGYQKAMWHFIPPHRRRLDEEAEEQRHTLHSATMNDKAIARMVGRDRSTIRFWRVTRGLPSNCPWCAHPPGRASTADEITAFVNLYGAGRNDSEIARLLGRPRCTIRDWRVKRRLPANLQKPTGGSVYLRKAKSMDASMFEDGGQLHDIVRDDSWSTWLEEMGATMW